MDINFNLNIGTPGNGADAGSTVQDFLVGLRKNIGKVAADVMKVIDDIVEGSDAP